MKMAATLPDPKSRRNGLDDLVRQLVDNVDDQHVIAVVVLDVKGYEYDKDKHTKTPAVRVQHLEPMLTEADQKEARQLLETAYRRRTSEQLELDFEIERLDRDAPQFYPTGV